MIRVPVSQRQLIYVLLLTEISRTGWLVPPSFHRSPREILPTSADLAILLRQVAKVLHDCCPFRYSWHSVYLFWWPEARLVALLSCWSHSTQLTISPQILGSLPAIRWSI